MRPRLQRREQLKLPFVGHARAYGNGVMRPPLVRPDTTIHTARRAERCSPLSFLCISAVVPLGAPRRHMVAAWRVSRAGGAVDILPARGPRLPPQAPPPIPVQHLSAHAGGGCQIKMLPPHPRRATLCPVSSSRGAGRTACTHTAPVGAAGRHSRRRMNTCTARSRSLTRLFLL